MLPTGVSNELSWKENGKLTISLTDISSSCERRMTKKESCAVFYKALFVKTIFAKEIYHENKQKDIRLRKRLITLD